MKIEQIALHKVGNRATDDGTILSMEPLEVDDKTTEILTTYFTSPFQGDQQFNLAHPADLNLNEVYTYVGAIFDDPQSLHQQSVNLAKHLYQQSNHPKIKGGEFYVVHLSDCTIQGEAVDAVGLFKSENKDTFLKVHTRGTNFEIESQQGININKLDKGALIFNINRPHGYIVKVVDNTNKGGGQAQYWIDEFLGLSQQKNEYYNTENAMSLAKSFVAKELPKAFEVSKADQADMLQKTAQFFKENDNFDMEEFAQEVIIQPSVIESFNNYKETYQQDHQIEIADSFTISDTAVKKQARTFKSVIKLDKNFHIYIHGDRQLIEQGEDNKGRFYKVYYTQEQ